MAKARGTQLAGPAGAGVGADVGTLVAHSALCGLPATDAADTCASLVIVTVTDNAAALVGLENPYLELPRPALTQRERDVLLCWLVSDSKTDVCTSLGLSAGTVKTHLHRIRGKYEAVGRNASTKAALVARALQDGLIRLEDL